MSSTENREPDTYAWRTAPAHLMTRRQLRAAGLAPGGHAPVAQTETMRRGRRLVTYFYDSRLAVSKRTATPKQLRAIAKAIREHQARAAERHGYDRAELDRAQDPAPGWDHNPEFTTHKEENTMSDTTPEIADDDGEVSIDVLAAHDYAEHLDDLLAAAESEVALSQFTDIDDNGRSVRVGPDEEAVEELTRLREEFDQHLRKHRDILGEEPWLRDHYASIDTADAAKQQTTALLEEAATASVAPSQEVTAPVGHGQKTAYLLATVACNQARQRLDKLDTAVELAEREGRDSVDQLEASLQAAIDRAEARLDANPAQQGAASVEPLVDALVYRTGSDIAADRLDALVRDYGADWGVVIDAEELSVTVDPDFDPIATQTFADAECMHRRASYAVDIVTALPMSETAKAAATDAVRAWAAEFSDPGLHDWRDTEGHHRAELGAALAAAKLGDADRARVEFVVDFLRGDVSEVDLLVSPVFVDPGEEVRSRIPELLQSFAKNPEAAKLVGEEIAVMTEQDQERVRAAGKAIARGEQVDPELWPGYVDRQGIDEALFDYATEMQELRSSADYLAEGGYSDEERENLGYKTSGAQDELSATIDRLTEARETLLATARDGKGLASIERAHIAAIVEDIDNGRTELPELLFADEHTKCDADFLRRDRAAARLATDAETALTQQIDATAAVDPKTRAAEQVSAAVDSIAKTLESVAGGSQVTSRAKDRAEYREHRSRLGQALAQAGVPKDARGGIAAVLDEHARKAGEVGADAIDRRDQWNTKIAQAAEIRDDTIRQRQAADAGRAKPPDAAISLTPEQRRACTARIDTSRHGVQSPVPAGIRQLHSMEVER